MIPFFFNLTFGSATQTEPGNTLAMMVMVVVNLSGILNGALYLFLRRGSLATISPRGHRFVDLNDQVYKIQARSPIQVDFSDHLKQPVPGFDNAKWMQSSESLNSMRKAPIAAPDVPPKTYSAPPVQDPQPAATAVTRSLAPDSYYAPPRSPDMAEQLRPVAYSAFPANRVESTQSFGLLPSTTYNPNQGQPAVSPVTPGFGFLAPPGMGHRRSRSSLASSATVRIGLRISNVDDMRAISDRQARESAATTQFAMPALPMNTAVGPSPLALSQDTDRGVSVRYSAESKILPPVPSTTRTASPIKTVSPRGVGFNLPRRGTSPIEETAVPAPLRVRGGSGSRSPTSAWI